MRWVLALAVIVGCAHEAPPPARRATASGTELGPPEELLGTQTAAPPAQTLASRFETRRIGEEAPPATLAGRGGALVDIDVKDADVQDVLRLIADVGHVSIVVAGEVSGRVNMRLRRVPWRQALDAVTSTKGLAVAGEGNVLVISPR